MLFNEETRPLPLERFIYALHAGFLILEASDFFVVLNLTSVDLRIFALQICVSGFFIRRIADRQTTLLRAQLLRDERTTQKQAAAPSIAASTAEK